MLNGIYKKGTIMNKVKTSSIEETADSLAMMRIGAALGAHAMLKKLEPALSDGTRHESPLCAKALRKLPEIRQQLTSEIEKSLDDMGISVSLSTSFTQPNSIEHKK